MRLSDVEEIGTLAFAVPSWCTIPFTHTKHDTEEAQYNPEGNKLTKPPKWIIKLLVGGIPTKLWDESLDLFHQGYTISSRYL